MKLEHEKIDEQNKKKSKTKWNSRAHKLVRVSLYFLIKPHT